VITSNHSPSFNINGSSDTAYQIRRKFEEDLGIKVQYPNINETEFVAQEIAAKLENFLKTIFNREFVPNNIIIDPRILYFEGKIKEMQDR
jgi:hypothetical protein